MDIIRPKSGNLRIQGSENRQKGNRYEQRRLSKQICKSINILPIKIQQNQHNNNICSDKQVTMKTINSTFSKHNFGSNQQLKRRKTLLSIKSKHSLRINDDNDDYINNLLQQDEVITTTTKQPITNYIRPHAKKRTSIQLGNMMNNLSLVDDDCQKIFQLLKNKKQIMMMDHNKLIMQASKFKLLLNDFQLKYKQVKSDRDELSQRVNKYQYYFKEMRLKHVPDSQDMNDGMESNHQLKILNLQKKQYRGGNNQQIKVFQQRLKQFKPNIQKQLTQKLAESNDKYQKLLKKVQFFQSQCKDNLNMDWHQLINEFQLTKQQNIKNLQYITELTGKLQELQQLTEINQQRIKQINSLQQQTIQQKQKIELLNDKKYQLQELIEEKDKKLDQLNHMYQETTFKLQGLQNLQFRIDNKQKTIKKNTIVINRLQCQNIQLKSKMDTVLSQFQSKIFSQKTLQSNLLKANNDIHQLTNRLHQTFIDLAQNLSPQSTKQKQFFIGHLFEKVKSSYNQIIAEYQNQLKLINGETEKWKITFQVITKSQQEKIKHLLKINQEIKVIQEKKLRCQGHFNNLSNQALDQSKKQCINCKHFVAYWGQLQNSYNQLKKITSDIIQMQSLNPTSTIVQKQFGVQKQQFSQKLSV